MYESTVMPIDTMRPVMPARSKLGATDVWPSDEMMAQSINAVSNRPEITTNPRPR